MTLFRWLTSPFPTKKAVDSGGLDRVCLQDRSAGGAPAAEPSADPGVERAAPATHIRPARGLFDRREVLYRCPQTERPTRGLGVRRQRAGRHDCHRRRKGNHQLTHRLSPPSLPQLENYSKAVAPRNSFLNVVNLGFEEAVLYLCPSGAADSPPVLRLEMSLEKPHRICDRLCSNRCIIYH
jgi:hypothetical protein